ncbi:MAG: methyltransferase [archaeon]|nr:methyltransferase [archaeon]
MNKIRKYKVFIGDYLNVMQKNGAYYDRILFNPPIKVGQDTYIDHIIYALKFLKENGSIFIVIKKKLGAESVNRKLESKIGEMENFDNIELKIIAKNSGYWITKISKIM